MTGMTLADTRNAEYAKAKKLIYPVGLGLAFFVFGIGIATLFNLPQAVGNWLAILAFVVQIARFVVERKAEIHLELAEQLRRMDLSLEDIDNWNLSETPYHVSGRCSVFCKSDCTHATNKGVPKPKVTAGLCQMMANKILELLKKVNRQNIMITGGTALNKMMTENLKKEIEEELNRISSDGDNEPD